MIDPSRRLVPSTLPEDHPIHDAAEAGARTRLPRSAAIARSRNQPRWRSSSGAAGRSVDVEQVVSESIWLRSLRAMNGRHLGQSCAATAPSRARCASNGCTTGVCRTGRQPARGVGAPALPLPLPFTLRCALAVAARSRESIACTAIVSDPSSQARCPVRAQFRRCLRARPRVDFVGLIFFALVRRSLLSSRSSSASLRRVWL
jgi:hypothetical protein